jgi:predicted  nucleic acid-binding Zn-ribbon protein
MEVIEMTNKNVLGFLKKNRIDHYIINYTATESEPAMESICVATKYGYIVMYFAMNPFSETHDYEFYFADVIKDESLDSAIEKFLHMMIMTDKYVRVRWFKYTKYSDDHKCDESTHEVVKSEYDNSSGGTSVEALQDTADAIKQKIAKSKAEIDKRKTNKTSLARDFLFHTLAQMYDKQDGSNDTSSIGSSRSEDDLEHELTETNGDLAKIKAEISDLEKMKTGMANDIASFVADLCFKSSNKSTEFNEEVSRQTLDNSKEENNTGAESEEKYVDYAPGQLDEEFKKLSKEFGVNTDIINWLYLSFIKGKDKLNRLRTILMVGSADDGR